MTSLLLDKANYAIDDSEPRYRTALYRLYDADRRLLYVGITGNIRSRWAAHASDKAWWPAVATSQVKWFDLRAEAAEAEAVAIKSEDPLHNVQSTPEHRKRVEEGQERRQRRIEVERSGDANSLPIRAKRAAHYWELHIPGVGVTQSRDLGADADEMIRSYITAVQGGVSSGFVYTLIPEINSKVDSAVAEAKRALRVAEELTAAATASNRAVARELSDAGLTGRDAAVVLGITPQRVSQLLSK